MKNLLIIGCFLIAQICFNSTLNAASSNFIKNDTGAAKARIIASYKIDDNGQAKLLTAIHFKFKNGWKIYAPGGDSAFSIPPSFNFNQSSNIDVNAIDVTWPPSIMQEENFGHETIRYAIYKDEVIIPIALETIDPQRATRLNVTINYGLCNDICIPVEQELSLQVAALEQDPQILYLIENALNPQKAAPQPEDPSKTNIEITLIKALLIAFLGGLILNIMPCVLPVLSIKLLSIVNHSGTEIKRIKEAYFATTLGIIFSFLILATITSTLKILGNSLGWGFQFQNPYFLIFLIIVLIIFTANLLDIFTIHFSSFINDVLNKKISKEEKKHHIFVPNFLSGILAVLLATPCSAPFLGTAISFALSQNITKI
ncbi:MAG: protein-disulfide reductase DsbD family protein, partial [Proteobacteria bacterium]|nr:protein-disulfide reductase DsbD family protein [Pseudomonadota bacterium]